MNINSLYVIVYRANPSHSEYTSVSLHTDEVYLTSEDASAARTRSIKEAQAYDARRPELTPMAPFVTRTTSVMTLASYIDEVKER